MSLSTANNAALIEFTTFGRRRREQCVEEVAGEFKETREMRLFEDHYTKDDVEALMDGLLALVRTTLQTEMKGTIHSSLLLIKQMLEQAEAGGVKVGFDVSRAQDAALLREVEAWEAKVAAGSISQLMVKAGGSAPTAFNSVGVVQDASSLMVCLALVQRALPRSPHTENHHHHHHHHHHHYFYFYYCYYYYYCCCCCCCCSYYYYYY